MSDAVAAEACCRTYNFDKVQCSCTMSQRRKIHWRQSYCMHNTVWYKLWETSNMPYYERLPDAEYDCLPSEKFHSTLQDYKSYRILGATAVSRKEIPREAHWDPLHPFRDSAVRTEHNRSKSTLPQNVLYCIVFCIFPYVRLAMLKWAIFLPIFSIHIEF